LLAEDLKSIEIIPEKKGVYYYSNFGYVVLGEFVRRVSGAPQFLSLLKKEILIPAGLDEVIKVELNMREKEYLCHGHTSKKKPVHPYFLLDEPFSSCGNLFASSKGLLESVRIFLDQSNPVSPFIQEVLETKEDRKGEPLSLGLRVRKTPLGLVFFHPGGIAGHKSLLAFSPKQDLAVGYNTTTLKHVDFIWDIIQGLGTF
jgi:hypothetical protein